MKVRKTIFAAGTMSAILLLTSCSYFVNSWDPLKTWSPWARSVSAGSDRSQFLSVAHDSSGNVYAAGYFMSTGVFTFGPEVSVSGASGAANLVVVKYGPDGTALWARTVSTGSPGGEFDAVTVDASGNVYAAGFINTSGTFTFGPGIAVENSTLVILPVLVKYDASGNALWARSADTGASESEYQGVAVDSSGNVYAAGYIAGTGADIFGPGVSASGVYVQYNSLLVKYDTNGSALWADSATSGANNSFFYSVGVDASDRIYAGGYITGNGTFGFGGTVTAQGSSSVAANALLVSFNSDGSAAWARTTTAGLPSSVFYSISADSSGNIFAGGFMFGALQYDFGPGVMAQGSVGGGDNALIVKYDSTGTAVWAKTVVSGSSDSDFWGVSADSLGNVYAVGAVSGSGSFSFASGVSAQGTAVTHNIVLVKYDPSGLAQWARSVTSGDADSLFDAVSIDPSGNIDAAGYLFDNGTYTFEPGVYAEGAYAVGANAVVVKYLSRQ